MLTLLLNPTIRKVLIVFGLTLALLLTYAMWSAHMQKVGAEAERVREEAVAIRHEQEVTSKATAIDREVAKDPTPQDTLQKEWSK
jgi:cytochrome c-type biogenesis protein CcmH/NrfG